MALFAQSGVESDIATVALIENTTPWGWHNECLPKLYQHMRVRNPTARISVVFLATSSTPPIAPAPGSQMLPDVMIDPRAPPISVGTLLYAALVSSILCIEADIGMSNYGE